MKIEGDLFASSCARIRYVAPDSRGTGRETVVQGRVPVPPYLADTRDEDAFARWLQHTLLDLERHESQEWLRRDGEIYDDPHRWPLR